MVRKFLPLLLLPFLLTITTFAVNAAQKNDWELVDETVAVVNGEPILLSDIKLYELLFGIKDFKEALQKLIDIYVVAQYAESKGLEIPSQKVSEIVENFAKSQGLSVEKLYTELQRLGLGGAVFENFIKKYNLYVAAIQLFVLKPLHQNKEELEILIASRSPKAEPFYTFEILKIPKKEAVKYQDLLVSGNFEKIAKTLKVEPLKLTATLDSLKPQIAKVLKRLKPGMVDFAEDKDFLYVLKLDKVEYKIPEGSRKEIVKQIEEEKIREFIEELKKNSVIKILPEALPESDRKGNPKS